MQTSKRTMGRFLVGVRALAALIPVAAVLVCGTASAGGTSAPAQTAKPAAPRPAQQQEVCIDGCCGVPSPALAKCICDNDGGYWTGTVCS
jgi:hypothetical protein